MNMIIIVNVIQKFKQIEYESIIEKGSVKIIRGSKV